jgi:hypothetical protein
MGDLVRRSSAILERGGHALVRVESDSPVSVEVADLSDLEDWICSLPPGSVTLGESSVLSPSSSSASTHPISPVSSKTEF